MGGRLAAGRGGCLAAPATECVKHGAQTSGAAEQGGRRWRKQTGEKIREVQGTEKRRREEKEKLCTASKVTRVNFKRIP